MPSLRGLWRWGIILGLTVCLGGAGCSSPDADADNGTAATDEDASAAPTRVTLVETKQLKRQNYPVTLTVIGTLKPAARVDLAFELGGTVAHIAVDEGDTVKQGDLLAKLDTTALAAQVRQARVGLDIARRNLARNEKLHAEGAVSEQVYQDTISDVQLKEASLDAIAAQLGNASLTTPLTGVVAFRQLEVGEMAGPGSPAFTVMDTSVLHLRAGVPEDQVVRIHAGQAVIATVSAFPNHPFIGTVGKVGIAADDRTKLFPVEIHIPNPEGLLRPGMVGRGSILVETLEDIFVIPLGVTVKDREERYVFVVSGDTQARRIHLPEPRIHSKNLLADLPGEPAPLTLIVLGQHKLADGSPVRVYTAPAASAQPPA